MNRRRGFVPQPDYGLWPLARKLELDWIVGELNWFRADRHPRSCDAARAKFPGLGADTDALAARAHEWLCRRMLSTSPGHNLEAQAELYQLLADTAQDFNRTVFDSDGPYPLAPEGPWPFKYWSYMRWSTRKIEDGKAGRPDRYETAYILIDGVDRFYLDRIRRAHRRPIAAGEVPKDELIPPTLS